MTAVVEREPRMAAEAERAALATIAAMTDIEATGASIKLVGADGTEVPLPPVLGHLLHDLAGLLACGDAVTLVPIHKLLTTQQAADILNVSRPYLVQLLDRGEIPYTRKTTHRRIRFDELMAYKRRRDAERFEGLRELTRMSEDFGLYDEPPDQT